MCIIIAKPIKRKLPISVYENCFVNNPDGAGFAYCEDDKVNIYKGFFKFSDFWNKFEELEDKSPLIHFRVGTSGGNNGTNCHPWRISDNLVFAHNGTINITRTNMLLSDTGNFNEKILIPLAKKYPDFYTKPYFNWLITHAIGGNNKIVIMDNKGRTEIFGKERGTWSEDVWFSNNSYLTGKRVCGYSSSRQRTNNTNNNTCNTSNISKPISERYDKKSLESLEELDIALEKLNKS